MVWVTVRDRVRVRVIFRVLASSFNQYSGSEYIFLFHIHCKS